MADGRHIAKCWKRYNSPTNGPIWMKLGWSHPVMSPTCPHDAVAISKWRTAAMFENIGNTITRLAMDQLGRNLGGRIPSRSRHVRLDAVAIASAVA